MAWTKSGRRETTAAIEKTAMTARCRDSDFQGMRNHMSSRRCGNLMVCEIRIRPLGPRMFCACTACPLQID